MTKDLDPFETQEWLEAFDAVHKIHGDERANFLLSQLQSHASDQGIKLPPSAMASAADGNGVNMLERGVEEEEYQPESLVT